MPTNEWLSDSFGGKLAANDAGNKGRLFHVKQAPLKPTNYLGVRRPSGRRSQRIRSETASTAPLGWWLRARGFSERSAGAASRAGLPLPELGQLRLRLGQLDHLDGFPFIPPRSALGDLRAPTAGSPEECSTTRA